MSLLKTTISSILFFACILSLSCNKETKINEIKREPEELVKNLLSQLRTADSLSVFVKSLNNLRLTDEEAKDGITLFIPVNGNSGQPDKVGFVGDSLIHLTDGMLKDHIIKGVLDYPQLTVKKSFVTLSGKAISVFRSSDTIWVNGIQMSGRQMTVNNNFIVHTLRTSLVPSHHSDTLTTTSLDVAVWDATRWSPGKPKGELASLALVKAYKSIEDYNNGIVAAQGTTNFKGRAILKNLRVGTYYLEASLNGKTNVFVSSVIPALGYKAGYAISGIFQTQQEASIAPKQSNSTPGNFRWFDSNGDGEINTIDYRVLPFENAATIDGVKLKTSVTIGFPRNR